MIQVDLSNLNELERKIYNRLLKHSKDNPPFRINEAAEVGGCSVSKISKYVKKLGFDNYKQYIAFLYGEEISNKPESDELNRIKKFIDDFDTSLIDEFIKLLNSHQKIVLFGYGPSGLCAEYFEYKLRTCSNNMAIAVSDEGSLESMIDENSLLIIFTVTGTFKSFESIYKNARKKNCEVVIIAEEYNTSLFNQCDHIFWLSKFDQPDYLEPYQKSRIIFYIFIEEIMRNILDKKLKK